MCASLHRSSYGKSRVRFSKILRKADRHDFLQLEVAVELEGDFDASYVVGDNRKVVATDTMKNTVYVLALREKFDSAEEYALLAMKHFLTQYSHVVSAKVSIRQQPYARITVGGKPHRHSFVGLKEVWTCRGVQTKDKKGKLSEPQLFSGIDELLVLKTTESAWEDFHTDEYRSLPDAADRILATIVWTEWQWTKLKKVDFSKERAAAQNALLESFAKHNSPGVQATMWVMAQAALKASKAIDLVEIRLPNKHHLSVDIPPFKKFGLKNELEVFQPTDEPHGQINCTVKR